VSLSLEELSAATGLSARDVGELERYGLIASRTMGTVRYYDDEALVVARLAAGFGRYGIEARHLRMYKVSAEREAGLFEQLITPLLKQRRASARQEAVAMLEDLAELADDLRAAMVRSALRDYLGRQ
jgi:DNA-binding transcriptional MerR regulator